MNLRSTALHGVYVVEIEALEDPRGMFARTFCAEEFQRHGLDPRVAQCSVSVSRLRGMLRGMHYQAAPHGEAKLVRCIRGAVYDVALDLRPGSPSFRQWFAVELDAAGRSALYLPPDVAHGYQTLADDTEMYYQMSVAYHPEAARGVRWNDPAFGIRWPVAQPILAPRDAAYPDFTLPR